jgi:hypothetical protein
MNPKAIILTTVLFSEVNLMKVSMSVLIDQAKETLVMVVIRGLKGLLDPSGMVAEEGMEEDLLAEGGAMVVRDKLLRALKGILQQIRASPAMNPTRSR